MTILCKYAREERCDKTPSIRHPYTPFYDLILSRFRFRSGRLLEIGIGAPNLMQPICGENYQPGASLRMWAKYLPYFQIHGADTVDLPVNYPRIATRQTDATGPGFAEVMHGPWDIIIDDGSHRPEDQAKTFAMMRGELAPGGVYVIDDVGCADAVALPYDASRFISDFSPHAHFDSRLIVFTNP